MLYFVIDTALFFMVLAESWSRDQAAARPSQGNHRHSHPDTCKTEPGLEHEHLFNSSHTWPHYNPDIAQHLTQPAHTHPHLRATANASDDTSQDVQQGIHVILRSDKTILRFFHTQGDTQHNFTSQLRQRLGYQSHLRTISYKHYSRMAEKYPCPS